ncbi:MAG: alpha/beta fold hydrolase, partial [Marmoricola sp.]|nr:alpha/beta fold hydrolase [Marmoricola sp.]
MTTQRSGATTRRALIRAGVAASGGLLLAGGPERSLLGPESAAAAGVTRTRYAYGSASSLQHGDLWLPPATPTALVVLLHGGAFQSSHHSSEMDPIAATLSSGGYAVWNVEYRSVGTGGGFPNTFVDAAKAIDVVRGTRYDKDVVVVGYSAGGILGSWAASRTSATPGGAPKQPIKAVITLSGGLDLTRLASYPGLSRQMVACMGGTPQQVPGRYALADP